jgi:hypothetical protein
MRELRALLTDWLVCAGLIVAGLVMLGIAVAAAVLGNP